MTATAPVAPLVPDALQIAVPTGARVMVMSDLHLGQNADAATEIVAAELGRAIEGWDGPGVVVLAGGVFDLQAETRHDPGRCLRSHPRLTSALRRYADGEGRRVVALPGNDDGALAWHAPAVKTLQQEIGAEVALAVDLEIETGAGCRKVRVEHGHCYDPANAFVDPRNPEENPPGRHAIRDAKPELQKRGGDWLDGMELLIDTSQSGAFMASRLLYRRVARRSLVLLLPFVASAILAIVWAAGGRHPHSALRLSALIALAGGIAVLAGILLATTWWKWALQRPLGGLSQVDLTSGADPQNDAPRREARRLVGDGYAGYITGHTHEAELVDLGGAFYANSGCGGSVLERRPGRFGLPAAFAVSRRLSWIELEAGAGLHARLLFGRQPLPNTTTLERLCTHPVELGTPRPSVVAAWPNGESWPVQDHDDLTRRKMVRRIGAGLIAFAGLIDLASAITPPLTGRLHLITQVVPFAVPQVAAVLVALSGIALLLLSRGVRRGQSHAWNIALFLLTASVVLHVAKGLDFDEALVALLGAMFLLINKRHFRARVDDQAVVRGFLLLLGGAGVAVVAGVASVEVRWFIGRRTPRPPLRHAVVAVAQRLVGVSSTALPYRVDRFLRPTLLATAVGLAVAAGWLLFRPVVASRLAARPAEALTHARRVVEQYGGDTLAYFALRDDKRFFFNGETLIAYAVYQGVCLVSPDPIGPLSERWVVWTAFRAFADEHGWTVAVMGAGEAWLPIYRSSGMHDLYVGDEAVVDVRRFNLEGGRNKGLRQAVNRIAKYGYRTEFHDPAHIAPELEAKLRMLMTESRRGEVERGFSMTLGRIFSPEDRGLLLTVCFGPDDEPVAFCQYVPAEAIGGYSLDLMRRSEGKHPNGLSDFVVVETIRHLREHGGVGLGLNFATMRAVLAGERGDGISPRIQRWFLQRMSDSMQIESLWRFNAKFDPDWLPRYAVYDSPETMLTSAMAVAKAESFWELPIIGRFFKPKPRESALPAAPGAPSTGDDEDMCEPAVRADRDASVVGTVPSQGGTSPEPVSSPGGGV